MSQGWEKISDKRPELGVLFVSGFKQQEPGSAVALLGAALYGWLYKWNSTVDPDPDLDTDPLSRPRLSDVVLPSGTSEDCPPAHMRLSARLHLADRDCDARWMLAESPWTDMFKTPRFLGVARWIWKVSTCLLVMEFFVPMSRHWNQAKHPQDTDNPAGDRAMAVVYLLLMGVAAGLSVLFAALLFLLALADYLPIPRIDQAVRWVVVHLSAAIGDTYMLAHCPVQFAAMRSRVARDLAWLQNRCDTVAIVAHSQGAAIVHSVLREQKPLRDRVAALITLGQGITKFDLLWRMDWKLCERKAAARSRRWVTIGMAFAGLPAFGLVAGRWLHIPVIRAVADLPGYAIVIAILIGPLGIAAGVHEAMRTFRTPEPEASDRLALKDAAFTWTDYYASADPVSNGPLNPSAEKPAPDHGVLPSACNQVYNSGSVIFDHNGYLRNQDEFVTRLLNDLVTAAYPGKNGAPVLIADSADDASNRRRRFIRVLIGIRIAVAPVLGLAWWWSARSRALAHPMRHLLHLTAATRSVNNDFSSFLTAVVITAVYYAVALLVWRYARDRSTWHFFSLAKRPQTVRQKTLATAGQPR